MNNRYNAIIITLSTFLFWSLISLLEKGVSVTGFFLLKAILASLFSYTVFRFVVFSMKSIGNKVECLKKIILRNEYLAGKWIGYYIGASGKIRYFVETIEQDFDNTSIRGISYDENLKLHSTWTSDAVSIDEKKGKMTHAYTSSGNNDGDEGIGLIVYTFIRDKRNQKVMKMNAFFTDLRHKKRIRSYEEKIEQKDYNENELMIKAKELYEKQTAFNKR